MVSKRIQVEIAGMTFYVIGEDDAEYVKDLAEEANRRIEDVEHHNYRLNDVQLYILSLLNALDDMYKLKRSEKEATELVGDTEAVKEKLKEIDELKGRLKEKNDALEKTNARLDAVKESLSEKEEAYKHLERERNELEKARERGESLLKEKEAAIQALEEKNYETQMHIVDLQKEISVLRGDDE